MTPEDYFTNAVRMFLADGGTPESAHRLIDETATKPAGAKPSREEVEGAPTSPATSEEIARAIREAFAGNPPLKRQRSALKKAKKRSATEWRSRKLTEDS